MSLSNNPVATGRVMPPRWAHVRFPRGSMLGEPGNRGKQMAVLRDTVAAFGSITTPGGHVELEGVPGCSIVVRYSGIVRAVIAERFDQCPRYSPGNRCSTQGHAADTPSTATTAASTAATRGRE